MNEPVVIFSREHFAYWRANASGYCADIAGAGVPVVSPVWEETASPLLPAWFVGEPGEWNYHLIRAATDNEAVEAWADLVVGIGCECDKIRAETGDNDDICDWCLAKKCCVPDRIAKFDTVENPTSADWIRAGYGRNCSRCGYEAYADEGANAVGDDAVCAECMTLEDWEVVDPERAAEMRKGVEALKEPTR